MNLDWIDRIDQISILVIGDIMVDRYIKGTVDRVSPEAPVQVLAYQETQYKLGGAANVALNMSRLGAQVYLGGVIGPDTEGDLVKKMCKDFGINTDLILVDGTRNTTIKTRYMAGNQHLLRVDREKTAPISSRLTDRLFEYVEHLTNSKPIQMVLFQDYDKGVLSGSLIQQITALCKEKNIATAADPKFENFWEYQGLDLFKPNLREAQKAFEGSSISTEQSEDILFPIVEKGNHKLVLLTMGKDGLLINKGERIHSERGVAVEVSDVCGAGDTVISVAALGFISGLTVEQIAYWSNRSAAWACTLPGVVALTKEDLKQL